MSRRPVRLTRRGERASVLLAIVVVVFLMGLVGGIEQGTIPLP